MEILPPRHNSGPIPPRHSHHHYVGELPSSGPLRAKLAAHSKNPYAREFFEGRMDQEGKQTMTALRARMDSLFASATANGTSAPFPSTQP